MLDPRECMKGMMRAQQIIMTTKASVDDEVGGLLLVHAYNHLNQQVRDMFWSSVWNNQPTAGFGLFEK